MGTRCPRGALLGHASPLEGTILSWKEHAIPPRCLHSLARAVLSDSKVEKKEVMKEGPTHLKESLATPRPLQSLKTKKVGAPET